MELRVLRYFLAVAREESISGAADFLHITQPTLSRQLMDLEEELGVALLIRGKRNRKISLTEEGILLRKRATEIVELADKTEAELVGNKTLISGDIYIGGGETDAMRLIAGIAKDLQKEYPQIRYHLYSGNGDDVTERLDKGLLDFGILITPINMAKYDHFQLPRVDTWGILMQKDSPLAALEGIRAEDLKGVPLLISRQSLVGSEISNWSGGNDETFHIVGTYNLLYNAALMVDEGFGYALCLDKLINTSGNSNLCFRPLIPPLEANLDIAWKKGQVFSKAATKFLNKLQEAILLI